MVSSEIVVTDPVGLHARPAAIFVKLANQFAASIMVKKLAGEGDWVDAKSILSLLTAGVSQADRIIIQAEGSDEAEAIQALTELVRSDFSPH